VSTIVVTGATGLLGTHTLASLHGRHEIHALVRTRPAQALPDVVYHERDLTQPWTADGLPGRVDAVCHLAQSTRMRDFPGQAADIFAVNLAATASLLEYARHARASHFVLASTGGLYGVSEAAITEDTPLNPPPGHLGYYFQTKRSAELLASAYLDSLNVVVLRPFFMYGPGQHRDMLIPRLIASVRSGRPIAVRGASGTWLNPIYVDDAAAVLHGSLGLAGHQVVNVAGPQVVSIRYIAERIGNLLGVAPVIRMDAGEPDRIVSDIARTRTIASRDLIDVDTGIAMMVTRDHWSELVS
jgi:nucleoside-diphosphate-sugar epimerase